MSNKTQEKVNLSPNELRSRAGFSAADFALIETVEGARGNLCYDCRAKRLCDGTSLFCAASYEGCRRVPYLVNNETIDRSFPSYIADSLATTRLDHLLALANLIDPDRSHSWDGKIFVVGDVHPRSLPNYASPVLREVNFARNAKRVAGGQSGIAFQIVSSSGQILDEVFVGYPRDRATESGDLIDLNAN